MIHPIVCWKLDDLVVGRLLGTGDTLARPDERGVTSGLAEAAIGAQPVESARLERRTVPVRLGWSDRTSRTLLADKVPIPVDVVIGELPSGVRVWLPRLGRELVCNDPRLLTELVDEEVTGWARDAEPADVLGELRAPAGWLTWVNARRAGKEQDRVRKVLPEVLVRVAEPEPARSARRLEPGAWGREDAVNRAAWALGAGRHVLIVGERGVGKSTVLRDAIKAAAERAPSRSFWRTTTHRVVAGARYLGEWQEKADEVADALVECEGVLWVEDLDALFTYGDPSASIAAYWRRRLLAGAFPLCGELTPRAWEVVRTLLPDVAAAFVVVEIAEMPVEATRAVVDRFCGVILDARKVDVGAAARRRVIRLLERFVRYERFPGKAIRLVRALSDDAAREGRDAVTDADVVASFEDRTGLPRHLVDDAVPLGRADLEARLSGRIVGQPDAVDAVVRALLTWKAGLDDPDRPVATLLFAGPTGVGKTATTKALGELCFGAGAKRDPVVRVDASELGSADAVERLFGSRRDPSAVVRQLRERPFSVLLLDEVEKAHPLLFDLLLGVLDEGRLVDALGRQTDLRGCVIVMTTNLGTRAHGSLGFGGGSTADPAAVRQFFRPEFVNRIDTIVHFRSLDEATVRAIARRELGRLQGREGFVSRAIDLEFTEAVVDLVVEAGFDPRFGARPLQRAIERHVVGALARHLVGRPDLLATTLRLDAADGTVVVR